MIIAGIGNFTFADPYFSCFAATVQFINSWAVDYLETIVVVGRYMVNIYICILNFNSGLPSQFLPVLLKFWNPNYSNVRIEPRLDSY